MKHPILVTECPKCGKMDAARSLYLDPKLDADGQPDPNIGTLMMIVCRDCTLKFTRVPQPIDPLRPRTFDLCGVRFEGC